MLRLPLACLLTVAALVARTPVAYAGSPVTCSPGQHWDGQKCQLLATVPAQSSSPPVTTRNVSTRSQATTCSMGSVILSCQDPQLGWWSAAWSCYVKLSQPQPPKSAAVWSGHADGAIYDCAPPRSVYGVAYQFWWKAPPAAAPAPDPAVAAQTAVASMSLRPITIGIVPKPAPGSIGLVGMPVWMWVASPAPQSWGPITRTVTAGGATVTATARVEQVRWLMGDGSLVVCIGPGTVYQDRFGESDSPTCGYTYQTQGTYTVRAQSQWLVTWSGMGQSGTIPLTLTSSTTITIGELQVVTTG